MNMTELRESLAISTKKGVSFTLAALMIWIAIAIIYLTGMDVGTKNFIVFFAGGAMFPLSVLFSKLTGAQWNTNDHPLGPLGLILNIAQLMYFPIIFWAFSQAPERFILFYGIITMAHLFPYGWLYRSKAYYIIAPISSIALVIFAGNSTEGTLWIAPLLVMVSLVLLNAGLLFEVATFKKTAPKNEVGSRPLKAVR